MTNTKATPFTWTTENLAQATQGQWHGELTSSSTCICTDTRKIKAGDIFLAIKGDNFDGHAYLEKAADMGAIAAIVSDKQDNTLPQLLVQDTKLALGNLGKYVRVQRDDLKVVALTGSSGKTTTKEMLGSILSRLAPTLVTRGNLNNDLGVPMMLLELTTEQKYAVLELGANHVGEIAYTTELVKPQVAAVLNIGTAHVGEFGGRDGICTAKSEIFSGLYTADTAVVPAVDDYAEQLLDNAKKQTNNVLVYGQHVQASNVTLSSLSSQFDLVIGTETAPVTLNFAGEHNVSNALAAAACAHALGVSLVDIAAGLSAAKSPKGRLNAITLGEHLLIDDTYNANPTSMIAAAKVLMQQQQDVDNIKRIAVLGYIAELGDTENDEHFHVGKDIAELGVDAIYAVGQCAEHTIAGAKAAAKESQTDFIAKQATDKVELAAWLQNDLEKQTCVALFKGSRVAAMETLITDLTHAFS